MSSQSTLPTSASAVTDAKFLDQVSKQEHKVVRELLKAGQDVNCLDANSGETALHKAVLARDPGLVKELLAFNAHADIADFKGTRPCHIACQYDNVQILQLLLDRGARLDSQDGSGRSLLHQATWFGHADVVDHLIHKAGFTGPLMESLDQDKRNALHYAAFRASKQVVAAVIEEGGVSLSAQADRWLNKPSDLAKRMGRPEAMAFLVECEEKHEEMVAAALRLAKPTGDSDDIDSRPTSAPVVGKPIATGSAPTW